ncbi:YciI family protein [bacterium]|nr:YciI family protein [bacterium]
MKYMLLVYTTESCYTPEEREDCMRTSMAICEELAQQGKLVTSSPLKSVTTAKSLRVRDGEQLVTTGPFAETTEQLGGFYMLDVDSEEEAIAIAARIPPAKKGTIEIRALDDLPQ